MPLKRRNNCCDRERLLRHLQKRSYICYQSSEESSVATPCCRKYIHETCLAKTFYASFIPGNYRCPFCRCTILPFSIDEPFRILSSIHDAMSYGFRTITFCLTGTAENQVGRDESITPRVVQPQGWVENMERLHQEMCSSLPCDPWEITTWLIELSISPLYSSTSLTGMNKDPIQALLHGLASILVFA